MPSVFISYSHKDEVWKDRLAKQLGVLEKEGLLDVWNDRKIGVGYEWLTEIEFAINRATVAVLLISADFLTSKFILQKEIPQLLERRAGKGLAIFPLILQPCVWEEVGWLAPLQARPRDGRPLSSFRAHRREEELAKIAKEVLQLTREDGFARRGRELPDRGGDFLKRVEDVCRLREGSAEVERVRSTGLLGNYLRVWRMTGGIPDPYPVAAVEHGISRETLRTFLDEVDSEFRQEDSRLPFVLVYDGEAAPESLIREAAVRRVRLERFADYQRLIDFRSYLEKQTEKLTADPIYPPQLYVSQRMRYQLGDDEEETSDALAKVEEWLASPNGRLVVILGDFGTGKTFLLHELARRMGSRNGGLVPILLQMRSLEKGRDLSSLLAQHFSQDWVEDFTPGRFRYMLAHGHIALLFDGFDELALRVTYERATQHFDTLLQAATGAAKVVVTSRRQHFLSDQQVKTALTEKLERVIGHRLAILQPFDRNQIHGFLTRFSGDRRQAEKRLVLLDHVKDLLGLSHNPRLLCFIAELPERQLLEAEKGKGEITAAKLYELLLERWLVGEFERVHPKGAPPGLTLEDRWRGVTALALRLWQKTDSAAGLSELTENAARVIEALDPAVAAFQLGSGTLLVRDEDGNFSFLHQSILEWLVARSAAEELRSGKDSEPLATRQISTLMADFLGSLAGRGELVNWARRMLLGDTTEAAKKNALLLLDRLQERVREPARLAGQDLRGKDLSYQDLTAADFSGADLTGARLVGTRLEAARLTKARLVDADLSGASLAGADLAGANLTGARLLAADLRGVHLHGAVLRRAKLLGSEYETGALHAADALGAALYVPRELEIQLMEPAWLREALAWSPDGELLACASSKTVRLYEVATGRELRCLRGHNGWVLSVAFSPDGQTLVSGSSDNSVRLHEVATGRELRCFQGHNGWVRSVAFSEAGEIASGSDDRSIRLWDITSAGEFACLTGHEGAIRSLAFGPGGNLLASGSADTTIRLWDITVRREIWRLLGHVSSITSVALSPDGEILASGSDDQTLRLWEVTRGREIRRLHGHKSPVTCVAFSPDGQRIASGSGADVVLWGVSSGREIERFRGHDAPVAGVAFHPEGHTLASSSDDKTVRLWETSSGREILRLMGRSNDIGSVAFSPDGQRLASGCESEAVQLWEVATGRQIRRLQEEDWVFCVAFSPDGTTLASGSDNNTVQLWEVHSGRRIGCFLGHDDLILSLAFHPDGQTLASGSHDSSIRVWDIHSGRILQSFFGHDSAVWSVAFSPDGQTLASGSYDKTIRLWEVESGREIGRFEGHDHLVRSVAFSPDGRTLASGAEDNTVRLWGVRSGSEVHRFQGDNSLFTSVAFSPDGRTLASGSNDKLVRLWDLQTDSEIRRFRGHDEDVVCVTFRPDGQMLASSSDDKTIRLWDVATGACLAVLAPLPEGWVAFSPDGRYKLGGIPAGGFWHVINLCRFEAGELDDWIPGLRLPDDASFFDLPPWTPEVRRPASLRRER